MDCLIPTEQGVFKEYNVSTISHMAAIDAPPSSDAPGSPEKRLTFFGRMGTDDGFEHGIPNAWMASPPAHPFYMLELEWIRDKIVNGDINLTPETITGPIALRSAIGRYGDSKYHTESNFEQFFMENPSVTSDPTMVPRVKATDIPHDVVALPFQYIYPYSWQRDGDGVRDVCWSALDTFDAERCKELLAVDRWPSTTITFWSHTWEHEGHNTENLQKIQ
jgi:inositol phosphorylceramide mannosyltransferase catalytic subunit